MGDKRYSYEYPHSKDQLQERISNRQNNFEKDDSVKISGNRIFVRVEKRGHFSELWYIADLEETDGKTTLSGKLVKNPDKDGNSTTYKEDSAESFGIIVLAIVFFPITIILLLWNSLRLIFRDSAPKSFDQMNDEEKLDYVMQYHLHCKKKVF